MSVKTGLSDSELQARKDLADQLAVVMSMGVWKHVLAIFDKIENEATRQEDDIPISDLNNSMAYIAEARGMRKAINKIHRQLDFLLNGYK